MKLTAIYTTACLCLGALFCGGVLDALATAELPAPDLSSDSYLGSTISVHDYREDGIRIGPSYIQEKLILHNYGHGAASFALSWGSVQEAFNFLQLEKVSNEFEFDFGEAAVIGAGVIGLTTANVLLDAGYKVRVYADRFPPFTTYDPAERLWWPAAVSTGATHHDNTVFSRILKYSYNHFAKLASASSPYVGVEQTPVYVFDHKKNPVNDAIKDLLGTGSHVLVNFDNGTSRLGLSYDTFQFNYAAYIGSLYLRALEKGAVFIQRTFTAETDLAALDENVIFNCTGKGSRALFNDASVVSLRHRSVSFAAQTNADYILRFTSAGDDSLFLYAVDSRIIIGGPYVIDDDADLWEADALAEAANALLQP